MDKLKRMWAAGKSTLKMGVTYPCPGCKSQDHLGDVCGWGHWKCEICGHVNHISIECKTFTVEQWYAIYLHFRHLMIGPRWNLSGPQEGDFGFGTLSVTELSSFTFDFRPIEHSKQLGIEKLNAKEIEFKNQVFRKSLPGPAAAVGENDVIKELVEENDVIEEQTRQRRKRPSGENNDAGKETEMTSSARKSKRRFRRLEIESPDTVSDDSDDDQADGETGQ